MRFLPLILDFVMWYAAYSVVHYVTQSFWYSIAAAVLVFVYGFYKYMSGLETGMAISRAALKQVLSEVHDATGTRSKIL